MGNICHGDNKVKIAEEPVVIEYENPDVITEFGSTFSCLVGKFRAIYFVSSNIEII